MVTTGFEQCFREHFPRLVSIGASMTGSEATAQELAQEAFLRAHDRWDEVGGYERPIAWIRKVYSRLLVDHHRTREAERRAVDRLKVPTSQSPPQVRDAWIDIVADLPPRQRLIVTLFYVDDQSINAIAHELDLSPNSVKSALSKARTTLRQQLETERGSE